MTMILLDPTDERQPAPRRLAPRSGALRGNLAFLDISKPKGNLLIDRLAELLAERAPELRVQRYAKPTFAKPAPAALREEIAANNDFVVEALAD